MLLYLDTILYSDKQNLTPFLFKFAVTIIQFIFITVAAGWLCFVMSLCVYSSLRVFTCISTCAFGILKTCLN